MRRFGLSLALSCLLCLAFAYASYGRNGMFTPPLDDAFIHFRYAELLRWGTPYEYVAGEGYSSGSTSLLWPILLVPGLILGLQGTNLYVWALALGALGLAAAAHNTHRWVGALSDSSYSLLASSLRTVLVKGRALPFVQRYRHGVGQWPRGVTWRCTFRLTHVTLRIGLASVEVA